ncbi:hypothetical protein [Niveispirillum fermenti]|uniref:hypothetical protein n=1 Tax=Niveispirillum fermenti TaxID=1233113 RepID=UPI003A8B1EB8
MTAPEDAPDAPRRLPRLDWPRLALWLGAFALLGPALWNGFPVVFFDTGGYIKRVLDWDLEPGRSFFYGLFLFATSAGWFSFWGPVLAQAAATLWLIHLTLRSHAIGCRDWPAAQVTGVAAIGLSALTGISWYVAQLMPDILLGLLVLALWLLAFRWETLNPGERLGVAAIGLLALLSHMSGMGLAVGLVAVIAVARVLDRRCGWALSPRLGPAAGLVAMALLLMPTLHMALIGKQGYTPGGPAFVFGRLVQDGLAQRYLERHCPDATIRLCDHRDRMPSTANDFLWHADSPFRVIGWWGGADAELSRLVAGIIREEPLAFLATGLRAAARQLVTVRTGDGLDEWHEVTRWVFAAFMPRQQELSFTTARQQRGEVTRGLFDTLNAVHVPVAHLSGLGLLLAAAWGLRRGGRADLGALALFTALALLGNAFINGALSNPHDRYQGRVVWLATLATGMAMAAWLDMRRRGQVRPAPNSPPA